MYIIMIILIKIWQRRVIRTGSTCVLKHAFSVLIVSFDKDILLKDIFMEWTNSIRIKKNESREALEFLTTKRTITRQNTNGVKQGWGMRVNRQKHKNIFFTNKTRDFRTTYIYLLSMVLIHWDRILTEFLYR